MEIVPAWLRRIWDADELRALVLLSMVVQIFLILLGIRRKYSASKFVSLVLWSFYLSADYVAAVALGNLLSTLNNNNGNINDIFALWSPFLLLHLGGPDTITAYQVEDNDLWWRHFLSLLLQVSTAILVLLLSVPSTRFWRAAVPIYIAGILKYGERTWALRSASTERHLMAVSTPPRVNIDIEPSDFNDAGVILPKAYQFYQYIRHLVVDRDVDLRDVADLRHLPSKNAFKLIEIEISFIFDTLYTKAPVMHTSKGRVLRCISLCMIILSLIFLCNAPKGDYKEVDIVTTYVLLLVGLGLETISLFLLISSDWTVIWLKGLSRHNELALKIFRIVCYFKSPIISGSRWSNCMSQYSLISCSLRDQPTWFRRTLRRLGAVETWDQLLYTKIIDVDDNLKELIFFVERLPSNMLSPEEYDLFRKFPTVATDLPLTRKGVLIMHIATDICYHTCSDDNDTYYHPNDAINFDNDNDAKTIKCMKELSRVISNYMYYLLVQCPSMLTSLSGEDMSKDARARIIPVLSESAKDKNVSQYDIKQACQGLISVETDSIQGLISVDPHTVELQLLLDARQVARDLAAAAANMRWRVLSLFWVTMLRRVALRSQGSVHAKQLRSGGEFLTHVWLLIKHLHL